MPAQWILTDHRAHPLRQTIKATAHVRGFSRQPDTLRLCLVECLQTRQTNHETASTAAITFAK